jgi:peptidoglycan/LPS O-acetylase OafA/YrhL
MYVVVGHTLHEFPALHFANRPWLGRLGVLFFFVHTCLVLMRSLERSSFKLSGSDFFKHFYVRRAFRIYPLAMLFVAGTVLFDARWLRGIPGAESYDLTPLDIVSNFLLTQNLTFAPPVMGVLWSLPLEVQMYVLLPPLFLLVTRLSSVWPLMALWAISVPIAIVQPAIVSRASLAQYIPDFLPGVIAYYLARRFRPMIPHYWWVPALLAISAVFMFRPSWEAGWPTCLMLGLMIPFFHDIPDGFLRRSGAAVAKYSYGLYLWHTVAIYLAFVKLGSLPPIVQFLAFTAMMMVVPVALFRYIEDPLLKLGGRIADKVVTPYRAPKQALAAVAGEER